MKKYLTIIILMLVHMAKAVPYDTNNLSSPLADENGIFAWPTNPTVSSQSFTNYGGGPNSLTIFATEPIVYTNFLTGAGFVLHKNAHFSIFDQYGSVLQTGTNGVLSIVQTNGISFIESNGSLTISSNNQPFGTITASNFVGNFSGATNFVSLSQFNVWSNTISTNANYYTQQATNTLNGTLLTQINTSSNAIVGQMLVLSNTVTGQITTTSNFLALQIASLSNGSLPVAAGYGITITLTSGTNVFTAQVGTNELNAGIGTAVTAANAYALNLFNGLMGPTNGITATTATNIAQAVFNANTNTIYGAISNSYGSSVAFTISYVNSIVGTNPFVALFNGVATNLFVYGTTANSPLRVLGGLHSLIYSNGTQIVSNQVALELYNSDTAGIYGSNKWTRVLGAAVNTKNYNSLFDDDYSFFGDNSTNMNLATHGTAGFYDYIPAYHHAFYSYDLLRFWQNLSGGTTALQIGAFDVSITNVPGVGDAMLYRFNGYPGDPYPLPSVVSADDFIGGVLGATANSSPATNNTPTSPTSIDPAVTAYFSTCDTTVSTNISTSTTLFTSWTFLNDNYFLYYPLPAYYNTNNWSYTVTFTSPIIHPIESPPLLSVSYVRPIYTYNMYHTVNVTNITFATTAPSQIAALNDLVFWLKATNPIVGGVTVPSTNLWNSMTNGALWPFAGGNPTCDANNLFGNSFPITWGGFYTNAAAHGQFGISNNGTGYGATTIPLAGSSPAFGAYNLSLGTFIVSMPASGVAYLQGLIYPGHASEFLAASNNLIFAGVESQNSNTNIVTTQNDVFFYGTSLNGAGSGYYYSFNTNSFNYSDNPSGGSTSPTAYVGAVGNYNPSLVSVSSAASGTTIGLTFVCQGLTINQLSNLKSIVQQYESEMGR